MSRSKDKGTAWESACREYLKGNGFPYVHRLALGGTRDAGDLAVPGWLIECKNTARLELGYWMTQAEAKATRLGVVPVLLHKRRGHGDAGEGFATTSIGVWAALAGDDE